MPTIEYSAPYTGRINAKLFDEEGNEILLKKASTDNPQGFSNYSEMLAVGFVAAVDEDEKEIPLDTSKSYVLKL